MSKPSQTQRVVAFLRANPGATSLDIVHQLRILNTTGRISDARKLGIRIDARKDARGVWRFWVVDPKPEPKPEPDADPVQLGAWR